MWFDGDVAARLNIFPAEIQNFVLHRGSGSKLASPSHLPSSATQFLPTATLAKMRVHPRLLMATPTATGSARSLRPAPLALLPPIPLYRRLLRAHRKFLPRDMRLLGDEYVKSEFKAHRSVENPVHIIGFLTEWQLYAQKLEGDKWIGEKMDVGKIGKMSDQQLGQMYELMQAIRENKLNDSEPSPDDLVAKSK